MAQPDIFYNDVYFAGTISGKTFTLPAGTVTDAAVAALANIDSTKLEHRNTRTVELFGPTTSVAALTQWIVAIRGSVGTLISVNAFIAVVATGADRTVTVDLQKSTAGGAFATVLSATMGFTNASAVRTAVAGTISSAGVVVGDLLQLVVTVAGAAGAQATGLTVCLVYDENAA